MADQPLGELDVVVGVDWSDLQSGLDDVIQYAESAAQSIQDAFTDSATFDGLLEGMETVNEGLNSLSSAAQSTADALGAIGSGAAQDIETVGNTADESSGSLGQLADSATESGDALSDIDTAASSASDALDEVTGSANEAGSAVESAGESAGEAEGGLSGMVEQLTLLGEALAITEGLKEFGEEALTATATVQSVTVGLTALTQSATQADEIIESIKQLAATEPFAFPDIAPTVQKMVAMGVAAEAIPGVIQTIADTAAGTTSSFEAIAQKFDTISISGNATGRSLATLGLNIQALIPFLTDAGISSTSTAAEITAAFKALPDQAARVQVLQDALAKFAGTAVAEGQTIGGQWQIFKNQFEEVMVSVGDAIAPIATEFIQGFKPVLDVIQANIQEFEALPEPIKDVALIIAALATAAVPAVTGLAALGLGIQGLNGLMAVFAPESAAAATAQAGLGMSSAAAAAGVASEGTAATTSAAETETLTAATAEATAQMGLFDAAIIETTAQLALFDVNGIEATSAAFGSIGVAATDAMAVAGTAISGAKAAIVSLVAVAAGWEIGTWAAGIKDASAQLSAMGGYAKSLGVNLDQASASGDGLTNAITKLQAIAQQDNITVQQGALSQQQYALALLTAIKNAQAAGSSFTTLQGGIVGADSATTALETKVTKLNTAITLSKAVLANVQTQYAAGKASAQDLAAANEAVTKAQNALNSELGNTPGALKAAKSANDDFYVSLNNTLSPAELVYDAIHKINTESATAATELQTAAGAYIQVGTDMSASAQQVDAAQQLLDKAVKATGNDYTALGEALATAAQQQGVTLTTLITQWENLQTTGVGSAKDIQQAFALINTFATATHVPLNQLVADINAVQGSTGGMSAAIINGKLQLVGLGQAAGAGSISVQQLVSGTDGATYSVTTMKGAVDKATPSLQSLNSAAVQASSGLKGANAAATIIAGTIAGSGGLVYAESAAGSATASLTSAIGNAGGGLTYAMSAAGQATTDATTSIVNYAEAEGNAVDPTSTLTSANNALAQSFDDVASAANSASGAIKGASASGGGNDLGALESIGAASTDPWSTSLGAMFAEFTGMGQTGGTSDPAGTWGGGVDVNIAGGQQWLNQLAASINTTTASAKGLDYALTGGSLQPSLDLTTKSTQDTDSALQDLTTTLGTSSTSGLAGSIGIVTQLANKAATALTQAQSAGDPYNPITTSTSSTPPTTTSGDTTTTTDASGNITTASTPVTDTQQFQGDLQTLSSLMNEGLITASQYQEALQNLEIAQATGGAAPTNLNSLFTQTTPSSASSGPVTTVTSTSQTSSFTGSNGVTQTGLTQQESLQDQVNAINQQLGYTGVELTGGSSAPGVIPADYGIGPAPGVNASNASSGPVASPTSSDQDYTFTGASGFEQVGLTQSEALQLQANQINESLGYTGVVVTNGQLAAAPSVNAANTSQVPYSSPTDYNPYADLPGGVPTAAMLATQGSYSGGGGSPVTINITGMTPSNAQTVISQMTTALRQAGAKIT